MKSSLSLKSLNNTSSQHYPYPPPGMKTPAGIYELHPQSKFQKYRLKEEALNNKLFESVAFLPNDDHIY